MGILLEDWGARAKAVVGFKIVKSLVKKNACFSCTLLNEFLYIFVHGMFDVGSPR